MFPPPLLAMINEKLESLGYPPLDRSWNTAERTLDTVGDTLWTARLDELMNNASLVSSGDEVGAFAVVAEDHRAMRWVVDTQKGTIAQGDGEVDAVLTGTTEDLVLMLTEQENLGALLRSGRIRHVVPDEEQSLAADNWALVRTMFDTLRASIGATA
jgi:hypothetical protein